MLKLLFLAALVVSAVGYVLYTERRRRIKAEIEATKAKKETDRALNEADLVLKQLETMIAELGPSLSKNSIETRLKKAAEITAQQSKINTFAGQDEHLLYNNLELEKLTILMGILKEGHDPVIVVRFNSGNQQMPLSRYVATIQKNLN